MAVAGAIHVVGEKSCLQEFRLRPEHHSTPRRVREVVDQPPWGESAAHLVVRGQQVCVVVALLNQKTELLLLLPPSPFGISLCRSRMYDLEIVPPFDTIGKFS